MKNNFDIKKFYTELYNRTSQKCYLEKRKSSPCGSKQDKYLAVYIFQNAAYLRMYYTKENVLEVTITIERYGPNQHTFVLYFTQEELENEQTLDLLESIVMLIDKCLICPEGYRFESDFIETVIVANKNTKVVFPLTIEDMSSARGYWRGYQLLLRNIEKCKDNPKVWIDFVNSEYFDIFKKLFEKEEYDDIEKIINESNLPKYQKKAVISMAKKCRY